MNDRQLRAELVQGIAAEHLPTGLLAFYPVFFPPQVETQDLDGSNSDDTYCGYHRNIGTGAATILYGNEPYEPSGCDAGQAPNGDPIVEGAIGTLSHEILEAMTDPADPPAWLDRSGDEIGDICADYFGTSLGSTDPSDPAHTQYNQVINGHKYYTQTMFSNTAFAKFGVGFGCQSTAKAAGPKQAGNQIIFLSDVYPSSLPADGKSTADNNIQAWEKKTNYGVRDHVTLSTHLIQGQGSCGELNKDAGTTDDYGSLDITYTASTHNVVCGIVATESKSGRSSTALVYQGRYRALAPTAAGTFPTTLRAGGTAYFTVTFGNRSGKAIHFATIDFDIFPAKNSSPNVKASQVTLETSTRGRGGPFAPLEVSGTTQGDGAIQGRFVGSTGTGLVIGAHRKVTVTFRVTLAANVPSRGKTPVVSFEAYLDQLNPATASGSTLADTEATDIAITQ